MIFPFVLSAGLAGAFFWLVWQNRRAAAQRQAARTGYFDTVAPLFADVVHRIEASGFARMSGRWGGVRFDLQAVPDTLTFRKLPVLWVMVTLTEEICIAGKVHIMRRPTQAEVFSHFGLMPEGVALPPGFPDDCALRCEAADGLPLAVIAEQAGLFGDRTVKELVMTPKGLRIVLLGEEAERTKYLLYRDAEMGSTPFPAAQLVPQLQALLALRIRLSEEAAHG